jgi:hypothetical protein
MAIALLWSVGRDGRMKGTTMLKCNTAQFAGNEARRRRAFWGLSCLDGKWYVGSAEELRRIGVVKVEPPLSCRSCGATVSTDCECN